MLLTALGVAPVPHASRQRVGVAWPGGCRDLFQIQFQGSKIFVHFVYQPDTNGIMNRIEVPPSSTYTFNVTDSADATTRKVKYDHPLDGRAHFSQDGRIVTTMRNHAGRLDRSVGHLFSLEIAGIDRFRTGKQSPSSQVASTYIKYEQVPPDPLHIAGFWYLLQPGSSSTNMTNPVVVYVSSGEMRGVAIAPKPSSPLSGGTLVLFPRSGPPELAVTPGSFRLMFTGGFAENLADPSVSSSFLSLQYPVEDISTLRVVDFQADRGVTDSLQAADDAASGG